MCFSPILFLRTLDSFQFLREQNEWASYKLGHLRIHEYQISVDHQIEVCIQFCFTPSIACFVSEHLANLVSLKRSYPPKGCVDNFDNHCLPFHSLTFGGVLCSCSLSAQLSWALAYVREQLRWEDWTAVHQRPRVRLKVPALMLWTRRTALLWSSIFPSVKWTLKINIHACMHTFSLCNSL